MPSSPERWMCRGEPARLRATYHQVLRFWVDDVLEIHGCDPRDWPQPGQRAVPLHDLLAARIDLMPGRNDGVRELWDPGRLAWLLLSLAGQEAGGSLVGGADTPAEDERARTALEGVSWARRVWGVP